MLIVHSELNGSGLSLYSSVLILDALILNWMNGASRINSQWDCWVIESLKKTHRESREVKSLSDCRSAAELHHLNLCVCVCVCSLKSECVWLFIYATAGCDWEISPDDHCWPTECSDIMLDESATWHVSFLASCRSLFWFYGTLPSLVQSVFPAATALINPQSTTCSAANSTQRQLETIEGV